MPNNKLKIFQPLIDLVETETGGYKFVLVGDRTI